MRYCIVDNHEKLCAVEPCLELKRFSIKELILGQLDKQARALPTELTGLLMVKKMVLLSSNSGVTLVVYKA